MEKTFRTIRRIIADKQFEKLKSLELIKPEFFNWATDIFEGIHVSETPAANALIWTDGKVTLNFTFLQISQESNRVLNFLRNKGIQQTHVILTQMSLQPLNWFSLMAAIKGGFRMIPAANILGVQDIVYRFEKLMPEVVIADAENASKIEEAENICGKKVLVKIIAEGHREGWYTPADIAKEADHAAGAVTRADDPLFLFFTSGTTGMPKVAVHTHLSYPFGHLTTSSWIGLRQDDIHYNISQPGWAKFAWSSFFAPWNIGASIFAFHQKDRFNAGETLQLMEKHQITTFCAPPTVLRMLIQEDLKSYHFSLRSCVAAGEPLNPEVIETWRNGTGILIRDGFGQTESTCLVANLPDMEVKFGSMGKPAFLYDVVIADEHGLELPVGEEGNICVKMDTGRPNGIFKDYFGNPEKRKEVFKHGLYYTGDKAYQDEDGYIWFVGRDDDVIKSSDYRIGPFEVESVLLEHEAVLESAVVGSPHELKGLEVKAFVILNAGYKPEGVLADELFSYSRDRLSPYKMPRIIEFVTELPKTISGKIRRMELRKVEAEHKGQGIVMEQEYFYIRKNKPGSFNG
ncbi:branched-chain amino acid aminotransferase [Pedobacter lusitanus]|uniref:Branched-chain amino acid aminotransferase n=1 Tax=Pedobacter lusitanus TaxID=1503925 RepID=A0A0D0F638_9SPHI|nr:AMP-binding protein [Pedobacter lusitanus]KIO77098.1 branched-chain amino acid aminotransferase [Pedobacter lusitanus]